MIPAVPRRNPEEIAQLGEDIYERRVQPLLQPDDSDKFVAIDVATEEYEIDESDYGAITRLLARLPAAEVWLARHGSPSAYQTRWGR